MKLAYLGQLGAIAVGLIGCTKDTSLSASDQMSAGQALANEVEDSAGGFGAVNQGATAAPSCVTLSGDTSDPDNDSIPTHATLTFNCSAANILGGTTSVTGTLDVTDDQPAAIAWAFTGTAALHGAITTAGAATLTTDRTGSIKATQGTAAGPFELARTLVVTTVLTTARASVTMDVNNDWTLSYAPHATWTPGGVAITGTLTATGSWNVSIGSHAAEWTLATPTPLTLDPACDTRVTAGTLTGTYADAGAMHTVTVTWTGCGASTVTAR